MNYQNPGVSALIAARRAPSFMGPTNGKPNDIPVGGIKPRELGPPVNTDPPQSGGPMAIPRNNSISQEEFAARLRAQYQRPVYGRGNQVMGQPGAGGTPSLTAGVGLPSQYGTGPSPYNQNTVMLPNLGTGGGGGI